MSTTPIKRALIAVYDKTGIADFAKTLVDEFGIEIISTGGTAKHLKDAGVPVTMVEEVTGFPELLDGRVKTLHPKIHAGILADRDNPKHMQQLKEHNIEPIDMVVVNLYPFEDTIAKPDCKFEDAIEMIDIGGPCMLRAAAKNHKHVVVVSSPLKYNILLNRIRETREVDDWQATRRGFAWDVFWNTCGYDASVSAWLNSQFGDDSPAPRVDRLIGWHQLRYGENPNQQGDVYGIVGVSGEEADLLWEGKYVAGEQMSFNNYVDGDAALSLVKELTRAYEEPRASARAVSGSRETFSIPDPQHRTWLLTWTTYGEWLPGDDRGFVSRVPGEKDTHPVPNIPGTPYPADQKEVQAAAEERMSGTPVRLTADHAKVVYESFFDLCARHDIALLAASVMANHAHVLCQSDKDGAELLQLFKGNTSHALGKSFQLTDAPRWWTKSGSKRFVKPGADLAPAIEYVQNQKGSLFAGGWVSSGLTRTETARTGTARAEARGSSTCAVAFIKHTNACGCAIGDDPIDTYRRAYLGDPIAAAGGVLCMNFPVTREIAETVMLSFQSWGKAAGASFFKLDVWIAPSFDDDAIKLITTPTEKRKWGASCRLLAVGPMDAPPDEREMDYKKITGGMLVQQRDLLGLNEDDWKVVTKRTPTDKEMADLRFAWLVCKHTKSNAITVCKDGALLGNGAGQMSRVKSCDLAIQLSRENGHGDALKGAVAAGDAFFPVEDGPQKLIDAGITAIIQPGGSNRDPDTLKVCDEANVAMIITGTRHFKH